MCSEQVDKDSAAIQPSSIHLGHGHTLWSERTAKSLSPVLIVSYILVSIRTWHDQGLPGEKFHFLVHFPYWLDHIEQTQFELALSPAA